MSDNVAIALVSAGAAVLASLITGSASLGLVMLQAHKQRKAAEEAEFYAAAQTVLTKGLTMIARSHLWSSLSQGHSKPMGGLSVLLRLRLPLDPIPVFDPMIRDQEEINFAGARVVLHGDQETAAICNRVMRAANQLASAMSPRTRTGVIGYVATTTMGVPGPDPAIVEAATVELGHARKAFANHLRSLQGKDEIDVYAVAAD